MNFKFYSLKLSRNMSNEDNIDHDIINEDVIDREELIKYLTYLLEHDGEVEKFFERKHFKAPYPDIAGLKELLEEHTFDRMIRESHFELYTIQLYENIGEYDPDNNFLHQHIDWDSVCEELLDSDYNRVFDDEDDPFNIFREHFVYHI